MSEVFGTALPKKWSATRLKSVVTYLSRGTAPDYVDDGDVRAISQAANQDGQLDWTRTRFHNFEGSPPKLKGYLKPGDTLINSTGTGTLGRVGFFQGAPDGIPCMADSHITIVRADSEVASPRYAYYWLRSQQFQDYVHAALAVGATNQIELNREGLANSPFPLPALDEQRRIADFLDAETARIDQLALLRQDMSQKLVERENALRDELIESLAEREGYISLRRSTMDIQQGSSPQCLSMPRQEDSEWGVLKLSSVKRGYFHPRENKKLPEAENPTVSNEVRPGDLLVTRANTPALVGDVAVVAEPCSHLLLPDLIYRLNLSPDTEPSFVAQVMLGSRVRSLIESIARGSSQSMVKLRGEDIKSLPIPVASPSQQKNLVEEIAKHSQQTMRLRTNLTRQTTLLAERRQALITAAVTGQFDVSTASGRGVKE